MDGGTGLPASPNAVVAAESHLAVIFADGTLRLISPDVEGEEIVLTERLLSERPLIALAAGHNTLAAAAVSGEVWLLDATDLTTRHAILPGQGAIWSLAVTETAILTGGADGLIRRWDRMTGEPRGTGDAPQEIAFDDGSRGAEVWRSCALCHALTPMTAIAPVPPCTASSVVGSVRQRGMTSRRRCGRWISSGRRQKVADLFKYGPEAYTPGSRMPEQRIPAEDDRQALVEFSAAHDGVRWAKEKRPVRTWQTGLQSSRPVGAEKVGCRVNAGDGIGFPRGCDFSSPLPMHDAVFRGGTAFRRSQLHRMRLV